MTTISFRRHGSSSATQTDIETMLLKIFKLFGEPKQATIHTLTTECFILATRFARRQRCLPGVVDFVVLHRDTSSC